MNFVLVLLFLSFTKSSNGAQIGSPETVTRREEFSYQVSFRYKNDHQCGGSLVSFRHVVTAGRCCYKRKKPVAISLCSIVAGVLGLYSDKHVVESGVAAIKHHEDYDPDKLEHDIAIIKLKKGFERNPFVSVIQLPTTTPPHGEVCTLSGWATANQSGNKPALLQMLKLPIASKDSCNEVFPRFARSGMLCAGKNESDLHSCIGDTGGPLVCDGVLHGVVAGGIECSRSNKFGVYTDVAHYRTWIADHLSGSSNTLESDRISYVLLLCAVVYYCLK